MKKKYFFGMAVFSALILLVALSVLADVPAPPVNQTIGIPDTTFGNLAEADCRICHENSNIVGPTNIPDRHHLLYGTAIPSPSVVKDPDSNQDGVPDTTYGCLSCHVEDTSGGIIVLQVFRNCLLCHVQISGRPSVHHSTSEAQGGDCVHCHGTLVDNPVGCKQLYCAVASSTAGSTRGVPLSPCTTDGAACAGVRVCANTTTLCTTSADCAVGVACSSEAICGMYGPEGTCEDGHAIPTYNPSLVTPSRSQHLHICKGTTDECNYDTDCASGTCSVTTTQTCHVDGDCPTGETCGGGVECVERLFCSGTTDLCSVNTECAAGSCSVTTTTTCYANSNCPTGETCVGASTCSGATEAPGGCAYCHNEGTDSASGVLVVDNHDTHHGANVQRTPGGVSVSARCAWCHKAGYPHSVYGEEPDHIRWCENCHGYESLHNIAIDSNTGCLFGDPGCQVVIGGELPGYSHVGNNSDCWGCHGFAQASAPAAGPATPYLFGADSPGTISGYDTMVTLNGAALTNLVGSFRWSSNITLTAADGSSATLSPNSVTSNQMTVTIPAATAPGNYEVRAVKGSSSASNPIVISVKPAVLITGSSCDKKKGVLTVSGSGFGEKPAGTDAYINIQVNGRAANVISWSDKQVKASVSGCLSNPAIKVNALMGSAASGGGKTPRPCTGKKCR